MNNVATRQDLPCCSVGDAALVASLVGKLLWLGSLGIHVHCREENARITMFGLGYI